MLTVLTLLVAVLLVSAADTRTIHATAQETVALDAPWSFVAATEAGTPEAVLGGIPGLVAVYRWDAGTGAFEVWFPAAPAFLNTLSAVASGDALLLRLSAPSSWTRPALAGARTVFVHDGWNTIGWTGPAAPAPQVAETLGAERIVALLEGEWASFASGRSPAQARLQTVESGQALWAYSEGSRSATIPAASQTASHIAPTAEQALSELLPWFLNPPNDGHAYIVQPILELWLKDPQLGRELARAAWLADGIGRLEPGAVYGLQYLYDLDPALARRMLAYSKEEPVRSRNVLLLNALGEMSWQDPESLQRLMRQDWFVDGLSREERALITALNRTKGVQALYRDLLAFHAAQSATISLPLAGEVTLWVFHHDPFPPGEDLLAQVERSVRGAERLIGAPFPLTDLIVLLVDSWAYDLPPGGVNFGDSLVVLRGRDQASLAGLLNHEVAHFYLAFEIGPFWLVEGGANFAQAYIRTWDGSDDWEALLPANEHARTWCAEGGVPNVHALSDLNHPDQVRRQTCSYSLGQYFLTSLFNAIGEAAFSSALGELYGSYLRFQPPPTEEQIFRVFRKHVPQEREATFLDVYRRLHGGPFLDGQ